MSTAPVLPETAAVYWRPRVDAARLRRRELGWTLSTLAHTIPFLAVAALMLYLEPLSFPVAAIAIVHAWGIPALYANRGALVVKPRPRADDGAGADRARAARGPARATTRASCTPAPGSRWSAARWASGSWGRRARCSSAPAAGASTAGA